MENDICKKFNFSNDKEVIDSLSFEINNNFEFTKKSYIYAVQTIRDYVGSKDSYTKEHSERVSKYCALIGKYLGLDEEQIRDLEIGGLFHDVGKVGIPDSILKKEFKLTDDEYSTMKSHTDIGNDILSSSSSFKDIIPIVKYHHEGYDGTGYPNHLKGNDIPFLARIASIADAFDAMTSNRSYRDALPLDVVISEFERCKGSQFDPDIVDVFLDILRNHYDEIGI